MPAPMRHRIAADGLESGAVGIEGEVTIAERYLAVEGGPINIVPSNEGVAIDRGLIVRRDCRMALQHPY